MGQDRFGIDGSGSTPERGPFVGARPVEGGVAVRVWAPRAQQVEVVTDAGERHRLLAEAGGYASGLVPGGRAGLRYRLSLDGGEPLPDPASRFQPEGPFGPSEVVDPDAFAWTDGNWPGIGLRGQVLYEFHVGTFTPEGTWAAASRRLSWLRDLGVTVLEMMPVNEFAGSFGWGYDGVHLFAPTRLYGRPDDLRAFVNEAHRLSLGVILDVVYNHFGPSGNVLGAFGPYTSDRHANEWGDAVNFDGDGSAGVRDFVCANAALWIEEYHFDGLRIDATQAFVDDGQDHILAVLTRAAREAAGGRSIIVVGENEPQDPRLMRPPAAGGYGLDALWNDDLHHAALVALTGRTDAYYHDYEGTPQELLSAAKYGFLYQGQLYSWQGQSRGQPARDIERHRFIGFLENHDQVANGATGERLAGRAQPAALRAMTALLLLSPATPMLFQGQEFGSTRPFLYFADHEPDLAALVREGRRDFLRQFQSIADDGSVTPADPGSAETFAACRLEWAEAERHAAWVALHRDLLRLRREDPVFTGGTEHHFDGAVLGAETLLLRWSRPGGDDRILIINLGRDLVRAFLAEPLLAPPHGRAWRTLWSSEAPSYGGGGTPRLLRPEGWRIPGPCAVLLAPDRLSAPQRPGIAPAAPSA